MPGRTPGLRRRARPDCGFTLIELLVVMAIIGTLLSIAVPRYFHSLARARETVLKQDLSILREAIDKYYADLNQYPKSWPTWPTSATCAQSRSIRSRSLPTPGRWSHRRIRITPASAISTAAPLTL